MSHVTIACTYVHDTDYAVCVDAWGNGETAWVPKSLIEGWGEDGADIHDEGDHIEISVAQWFAEKEGLI
jgi:hypothetical protein